MVLVAVVGEGELQAIAPSSLKHRSIRGSSSSRLHMVGLPQQFPVTFQTQEPGQF